MIAHDCDKLELRVLILAPTGKDAALAQSVLGRAGVECFCCPGFDTLCAELERGAGAILLVEEAVAQEQERDLTAWLSRQPTWSDLPVLVLARPGADSSAVAQAMDLLGNVTVLERPIRVAALVSAIRSALRARQRQYQIREHLVQHRRAEEALREADRRKDEFLAILAHELRNPLAPISNSLHLMRLSGLNDPTLERVREMMERQVNQMVRLVDDLLEVSRITQDKIKLRKEPIDVAALVRSAVETSGPLIEAAGHQLALKIPAEPLTLEGDPVRLTQVLANLLNNASKYNVSGGQIWLTVRREGDEIAISVKDTGVGISSEMLSRIFDPFMQINREASRAQGGLGIGLTLVKRLVELHGGSVQARSAGTNCGSEFVVRLPLGPASRPVNGAAASGDRPAQFASRRVMVVDDNRDAANSMGALLKLLGADVLVLYAGQEALQALGSYRPDLVLLDIGMPGMDGYEVARRARRQLETRDVTLIALTGWGQEEDRHRSRSAGFDYHLIKPVDVNDLRTMLLSVKAPSSA